MKSKLGFTLIELLIVTGIVAVLGSVLVLIIRPQELFRQARDSQRLTEMNAINEALVLYNNIISTGSSSPYMGAPGFVYVSIPRISEGGSCPSGLPTGSICANPSSHRKIDATGWIPVPFSEISSSAGSLFSSLPIDPVNTVEGGFFYSYVPGGSWALSAGLESEKYQPQGTDFGTQLGKRFQLGSDLALNSCITSAGCSSIIVATASCSDSITNQDETDVDCGGLICVARCANSKICLQGSDCVSDICNAGICEAAPTFVSATGGTVTTSGNYKIHTFTSSETFTVTQGGYVQVLVVGGGGGGGRDGGGGGGGGEVIYNSAYVINAQAYTVTIGTGGSGGAQGVSGTQGGNSAFGSITATGGGGGGHFASPPNAYGGNGGNGGGGGVGGCGQDGGIGGTGLQHSGGNGHGEGCNGAGAGGGGGAGGMGINGGVNLGGNGGVGLSYDISGSGVYYGGGGGGNSQGGYGPVQGGLGGGGTGGQRTNVPATNGGANTGGGGGGSDYAGTSGNGGSGIVIVKYQYQGSAPTCSDSIQNQGETNTDCGGPNCSACVNGKICGGNSDCSSNNCVAGICTALAPTTSGLVTWFQADAISGLSNGQTVQTWPGSYGGYTATLLAGNPIYVTNVINGKPIVRFDGTDDYFGLTEIFNIRTVFAVAELDENAPPDYRSLFGHHSEYVFSGDPLGTLVWNAFGTCQGDDRYFAYSKVNGIVGCPTSQLWPHQLSVVTIAINSGVGIVRMDQISRDRTSWPTRAWDGDVAEILVYNQALSDSQVLQTECYLANKYNISVTGCQ